MVKADYITKALNEAGGKNVNALFELKFMVSTANGTFRIGFNDVYTPAIAFAPAADALQTALNNLASIGANGTKVRGVLRGPYYIEMTGANAGQIVPPLILDGALLNPVQAGSFEPIRQGEINDWSDLANTAWDNDTESPNSQIRFLRVKLAILNARINRESESVDQVVGQVNTVQSKDNQRYTNLVRERMAVEIEIEKAIKTANAGAAGTFGGVMKTRVPGGLPYGQMVFNPATGRYE